MLTRGSNNGDGTAVIEKDRDAELNDVDSTGQISISINSSVTVKDGVMQDLNFCNFNENRLMECRIKVGDEYVYTSPKLETGEVLRGDVMDTESLKEGRNDATAEIYSFSLDGQAMGQTNVMLSINIE